MFHIELAPLGGIFGPLKSDLGVFWPFRGPYFKMGKNKNANFSKSPHGPIFKFFVVIREVILQKMAPILAPVNFFFGFDPFRQLCVGLAHYLAINYFGKPNPTLKSFCFWQCSDVSL